MVAIAAGRLNRIVTIQQRAQSKDAEGGIVDTWSDFAANIWAERNNSGGTEKSATRQGGVVADKTVILRSDICQALLSKCALCVIANITTFDTLMILKMVVFSWF